LGDFRRTHAVGARGQTSIRHSRASGNPAWRSSIGVLDSACAKESSLRHPVSVGVRFCWRGDRGGLVTPRSGAVRPFCSLRRATLGFQSGRSWARRQMAGSGGEQTAGYGHRFTIQTYKCLACFMQLASFRSSTRQCRRPPHRTQASPRATDGATCSPPGTAPAGVPGPAIHKTGARLSPNTGQLDLHQ